MESEGQTAAQSPTDDNQLGARFSAEEEEVSYRMDSRQGGQPAKSSGYLVLV